MPRIAVVTLALLMAASVAAQDAAPALAADELKDLVARARAHQQETDLLLRKYSWVQEATVVLTKPSGEVVQRDQRKYRVFPVEGGVVTDLLEVDGRAPTKKELAANEKQNERMAARAKKDAARKAAGDEDASDDDANSALLELLSRTKYEIVGTQQENGRELIGIAFEPDPKAEGEGIERKLLRHSRGTVWLDKETAQPVRGESGAADKFRLKGVVGVKDFSLVAEQVRVHDEIWLPSRFHFDGDFTLLGVKRRITTDVAFSEYSRASVETEAEVGGAPEP